MATERNARPISSFFKFTELGDTATGKVREFRKSANGTFMVLEPAYLRQGRKGKVMQYQSAAIGISTDVSTKIDTDNDKGKNISFVFNDQEPTTKGSHKKIFRVLELNATEMAQLQAAADTTNKNSVYKIDEPKAPQTDLGDGKEFPNALNDEDDDLPF